MFFESLFISGMCKGWTTFERPEHKLPVKLFCAVLCAMVEHSY